MEKMRKNLKITSIAILILTVFSLVTSITTLAFDGIQVPEESLSGGLSKDIAYITLTIIWVFGIITLLPSIYIGLKGLKIAKNPDNSKSHMVWAVIMIILGGISAITSVSSLSGSADLLGDILSLISTLLQIALYVIFFREAKQIRNSL